MSYLPDQALSCHLFEANERLVDLLKQSATLHPKAELRVNHCCVSDIAGVSVLKINSEELGSSYITTQGDVEVPNVVLDDYLSDHRIESIDFMKMDIEGYEMFALRGLTQAFQKRLVSALYIEISSANLSRNGIQPKECLNFLEAAGFNLYYCKPSDLKAVPSDTISMNINGLAIPLAQVKDFPEGLQTDLLALHRERFGANPDRRQDQ